MGVKRLGCCWWMVLTNYNRQIIGSLDFFSYTSLYDPILVCHLVMYAMIFIQSPPANAEQ
jgi:hypothetical protein